MKTPWHLWVVGVLSLLWNAGGAYDWVLAHFSAESYLGVMTEAQREWYSSFPLWAEVFWALGVWGAIIGSVLLLLRSGFAQLAFVLSLIGLIGNTLHSISSMGTTLVDMMGPGSLAFTAAIIIVALGLWLYARAMTRRGVLR
ncbi:hypothetical protein [Maritimibacter sp. UBA3975]|uniref:hypothetical protein n=1 Tax=Maritimibacter sp. UBA3975 TaxID=1946833 RepID=UPI000C0A5862|nr:hypothetical protein [Maritimibacter sp. UBA3975]MAM62799.1 hypothetical protein [Maritimibacter sp.]|tara:strand:+ start:10536 stop:10961 length:426 start_codon:yes stop_codon:yes gene_type:complete